MKWYVLQVKPGTDKEVVEALRRHGVTALAPEEQRLLRRRSVWVTEPHLLFNGYVFVRAEYTDHLYYVLLGVPASCGYCGQMGDPPLCPTPRRHTSFAWAGKCCSRRLSGACRTVGASPSAARYWIWIRIRTASTGIAAALL